MILGLETTFFFYIGLAALFRVIFPMRARLALIGLIAANCVLLCIANPILFLYLCGQFVLVRLLYEVIRRCPERQSGRYAWLAFLGLIPMNLHIWAGSPQDASMWFGSFGRLGIGGIGWTVGASFFVIKSFIVLKEALAEKTFPALYALAGLSFLPSFSAGPIHGSTNWRPQNIAPHLSWHLLSETFFRAGWGIASLYILSPALNRLAVSSSGHTLGAIPDMYLSLGALYFDFSGYTLLALASARLFGVMLPENFNRPYLATSIREFWQRWHMSLNWFIGTYLFKPFVRATGSQKLGIFLAFICAGLWHKFSLGYLLWGIGHGFALALAQRPPAFWTGLRRKCRPGILTAMSWAMTMTWVALLSYTANTLIR
jgi:D-alanyl-lipoteichoic acid acyltransferase DltB (MBOAT superfamily)